MEIVRDDKVSKSDFIHNLPVYLVEQNMQINIRETCEVLNNELKKKFEDLQKQVDQRLVSLRQDFDMVSLKRSIEKKSDKAETQQMYGNHDEKLLILDNNFLLLAQDLETFQKYMNK